MGWKSSKKEQRISTPKMSAKTSDQTPTNTPMANSCLLIENLPPDTWSETSKFVWKCLQDNRISRATVRRMKVVVNEPSGPADKYRNQRAPRAYVEFHNESQASQAAATLSNYRTSNVIIFTKVVESKMTKMGTSAHVKEICQMADESSASLQHVPSACMWPALAPGPQSEESDSISISSRLDSSASAASTAKVSPKRQAACKWCQRVHATEQCPVLKHKYRDATCRYCKKQGHIVRHKGEITCPVLKVRYGV